MRDVSKEQFTEVSGETTASTQEPGNTSIKCLNTSGRQPVKNKYV
jgi:hypothetical protein